HREPALLTGTGTAAEVTYSNGGTYPPVTPFSGQPKLTKITQRSGDTIVIAPGGITNIDASSHVTRAILFDRDTQGRITAIHDPIGATSLSATNASRNEAKFAIVKLNIQKSCPPPPS